MEGLEEFLHLAFNIMLGALAGAVAAWGIARFLYEPWLHRQRRRVGTFTRSFRPNVPRDPNKSAMNQSGFKVEK